MVQYFNNFEFDPTFIENKVPKILYTCKTSEDFTSMPRLMHSHKEHAELFFVEKGRGNHCVGTKMYSIKQGDFVIFNQDILHDETAEPGEEFIALCIGIANVHIEGLEENQLIPNDIDAVVESGKYYNEAVTLLNMIHLLNIDETPSDIAMASYLLQALLTLLTKLVYGKRPALETEEEAIQKALKKYLDENYTKEMNLDILANEFHMSKYYLSRLFKELQGFSPIHYVIRRRIGAAQSLLINTDMSVTEIAHEVGYNNSNHFHTAFQKAVGTTPQDYREDSVSTTFRDK